MKSITKTFKLPENLARRLAAQAREMGCPEAELIREGLARVLGDRGGLDMQQLLARDIGVGSGPADLSSGKGHFKGYGRSRDC